MMDTLRIITTHTPDGPFHIIIDQADIARASGFGPTNDLIHRLPQTLQHLSIKSISSHPYQKLVENYYRGHKTALDRILREQDGSEFQEKVWDAISTISYGKTISYKTLADTSGNPAAVRAAGTICGRNRLILLIPCHRVLKSDGSLGSYLYGPKLKESLLQREAELSTRLA